MGPQKPPFVENFHFLHKSLTKNIPEKERGNGLFVCFLCCAQNHLFPSLPLLEPVNMALKSCGESSLVERRWEHCKWTLVGILTMY